MANYGYAFAPSASMQQPGAQAVTQPPQRAVEMKSLNLPDQGSQGQIAPSALLAAPGGGGIPTAQLLQMLMAAFAPQGVGSPMAGAPMPGGGLPQGNMAPRVSFSSQHISRATPVTQTFAPTPHVEFGMGGSSPSLMRPDGGVSPSGPMDVGVQPSQPGSGPAPGGALIDRGPMAFPVTPPMRLTPDQPPVDNQTVTARTNPVTQTFAPSPGFDLSSLLPSYKLGGFSSY
jgi:hypothetical protein